MEFNYLEKVRSYFPSLRGPCSGACSQEAPVIGSGEQRWVHETPPRVRGALWSSGPCILARTRPRGLKTFLE